MMSSIFGVLVYKQMNFGYFIRVLQTKYKIDKHFPYTAGFGTGRKECVKRFSACK